jgi:hypothetical protein
MLKKPYQKLSFNCDAKYKKKTIANLGLRFMGTFTSVMLFELSFD